MSLIKRKVAIRPVVYGSNAQAVGLSCGCCCPVPARFFENAAGKQVSVTRQASREMQRAPEAIATFTYGIPLELLQPDQVLRDLGLRYFR